MLLGELFQQAKCRRDRALAGPSGNGEFGMGYGSYRAEGQKRGVSSGMMRKKAFTA